MTFYTGKIEWCSYLTVKKIDKFIRFDRIQDSHERDIGLRTQHRATKIRHWTK